jgi:hypothetical protein
MNRFLFWLPIIGFLGLAVLEGLWVASPFVGLHLAYWIPVSVAGLIVLAAMARFAVPAIPIA